MRITSKGQVTIPQDVRERHGLLPGTEVRFLDDGETVRLVKAEGRQPRGRALVERLRGRARTRLTTDEIMALTRGE
jgi:AbrB family looped-hinge helix DNA binding protein